MRVGSSSQKESEKLKAVAVMQAGLELSGSIREGYVVNLKSHGLAYKASGRSNTPVEVLCNVQP